MIFNQALGRTNILFDGFLTPVVRLVGRPDDFFIKEEGLVSKSSKAKHRKRPEDRGPQRKSFRGKPRSTSGRMGKNGMRPMI